MSPLPALLVCLCLVTGAVVVALPPPPHRFNGYLVEQHAEAPTDTCGYASCPSPKPGMLNLHLVPHTHDDVGWLKTVDQYYYGSRTNIQKAGVQYIIDSVIPELLGDKNKRFIYVETAFLWKWWKEQSDHKRHQVRGLIANGQLEIIGGGWSMNDEAVTHYNSIVDQFTWGFRRLNDTFGPCARPKIGWQIDPFGHSREMASLFAQFGFDGLFFGRLDYQDKLKRMEGKTAEMIWQASPNLGKASDLFTGALYNNYQAPNGFCFDVLCSDEPIIDDINSEDYNADARVTVFVDLAERQAASYLTKNIILTMGEDFNYQDAKMWYKNLDKLIFHINKLQANGSNINAFYSTPSCYLKALHEADREWPVKSDDFFPYASDPHAYWTGYFSSRPTIKYMERRGNNLLQVCKQLATVVGTPDTDPQLVALREAMGVMQHHDAITGTEKQHVANDYAKLLSKAMSGCAKNAADSLNKVMGSPGRVAAPKLNLKQCVALNVSQCAVTEASRQFIIVLYNPSSQPVTHYVRVPVNGDSYVVRNPSSLHIPSEIVKIPDAILNIPGRFSTATAELVFAAVDLPPLGYKAFHVSQSETGTSTVRPRQVDAIAPFGSGTLTFTTNPSTGALTLTRRSHHQPQVADSVHFDFAYYRGSIGNNEEFKNRSSGAYIFRPNSTAEALPSEQMNCREGSIVVECQQKVNDWVSQTVRAYRHQPYAEVDWIVGPIPIDDNIGKEVVFRVNTDLKTNGVFYTDSNGRELLRRVRDERPTWNVSVEEPVAGNYYPVTTRIVLADDVGGRCAVVTDRAQGGSSLTDGGLELMVHRRLLHDDAFGVGEALNETAFGNRGLVARGTMRIFFNATENETPATERLATQSMLLAPWPFFIEAEDLSFEDFIKQYNTEFSILRQSEDVLPANVQILTLEPWKEGSLLLRLEHIMEKDEDSILSQPACVNVGNLFVKFAVRSMRETMLGANQWLEDNERLEWKKHADAGVNQDDEFDMGPPAAAMRFVPQRNNKCTSKFTQFDVILKPMQIRTFIVEVTNHYL